MIVPHEGVNKRVPLESDPNLLQLKGELVHEV